MVATNGARLSTEQKSEVSSVRRDYYGLSSYANFFLRPQDAKILAKGNGKKLHEIYRDVSQDPRIYAALTQRFGAAIGREIVVEAASDRRIDKKAADEVRAQIKALGKRSQERSNKAAVYSFGGFENATLTFLDARYIGYSVVEIDWAVESDRVVAKQLWSRDSSRFTFDIADGGWELRLITPESPLNGIALPPKKFLLTCVNSHDDSPYGDGLANKLFWLSWLKRQIQKWWAIFCDKHGSPTLKGRYSSPSQRDRLLEVMANISQQAGVALPEGVDLELLQAASTGTDVYSAFCGYCDTQAVEAILLQNLTTNITGGSYAASETHLEIREELVDSDVALLSDGPYKDLSEWITAFNYPDAEPPLIYRPRVKVADEGRARRDTAIVGLTGKTLSKSYLSTHYDISFADPEEIESDRIEAEKFAPKEAEPDPNAETPFVFSESKIRVGTNVTWKYGTGTATGKVVKIYRDRITLKLGNSEITRNGSEDDPAVLIKQENGARVLKLVSEVQMLSSDYAETIDFKVAPAPAKKQKNCVKGIPCKGQCINANKKCRTEVTGEAAKAADYLEAKVPLVKKTKKEKGGTDTLVNVAQDFSSVEYTSATKRQINGWETASKKLRSKQDTSLLADNADIVGLIKDEANSDNFIGIKDKAGNLQAASTIKNNKDHIYVDYLATAPWNLSQGKDKRSVKGAGASAMEAIIEKSVASGHKGAVKLEALEGAVGFYAKVGFVEKSRRTVFGTTTIEMELAPTDAKKFLKKRGK